MKTQTLIQSALATAIALGASFGSLAQAADAAILCVGLGSSAIEEAERILDELGRERVLGSVIFRERKEKR